MKSIHSRFTARPIRLWRTFLGLSVGVAWVPHAAHAGRLSMQFAGGVSEVTLLQNDTAQVEIVWDGGPFDTNKNRMTGTDLRFNVISDANGPAVPNPLFGDPSLGFSTSSDFVVQSVSTPIANWSTAGSQLGPFNGTGFFLAAFDPNGVSGPVGNTQPTVIVSFVINRDALSSGDTYVSMHVRDSLVLPAVYNGPNAWSHQWQSNVTGPQQFDLGLGNPGDGGSQWSYHGYETFEPLIIHGPPLGACCFSDGSCQQLTAGDCSNNGGSYQGDNVLCSPNPCPQPPPNLIGAVTRKNCDLAINLSGPVTTEPRRDGISQLIFHYDDPPHTTTVPVIQEATCAGGGEPGPYTGQSSASCATAGNDLVCYFNPALENARTYYFTLPSGQSNTNLVLRGLIGDVNNDGLVNATDRSVTVGAWTGGGFTCPSDVDTNGVTNSTDRSVVVGAWTGTANCAPNLVKKCPPGRDCFRTAPCGGRETKQSFAPNPIPADFFDPGSEPFTGEVVFEGVPLDPATLGDADTCMLRLDPLVFPVVPSTSVSGLVIERLRLRSAAPITATYDNGNPAEAWDVDVDLSSNGAPIGTLTANKTHDNGGTFSATFYVLPRFTFTRVADGQVRVLDSGEEGIPPIEFSTPDAGPCNQPSWVQSLADELAGVLATSPCFIPGVSEEPLRGTFQQISSLCHGASCIGAACPVIPDAHCVEPPMSPPP